MELKYGEYCYFLNEVECKEVYKEGDTIIVYQLLKRDNKPWLTKEELVYAEKGETFLLKGGVFRKEYIQGWLEFDLKQWKLKRLKRKESFKLNEPLCLPEEEREKKELKYGEEYVFEGERYKLEERGGPIISTNIFIKFQQIFYGIPKSFSNPIFHLFSYNFQIIFSSYFNQDFYEILKFIIL